MKTKGSSWFGCLFGLCFSSIGLLSALRSYEELNAGGQQVDTCMLRGCGDMGSKQNLIADEGRLPRANRDAFSMESKRRGRTRTLVSTWDRKERPPYHETLSSRSISDSSSAVNKIPNTVVIIGRITTHYLLSLGFIEISNLSKYFSHNICCVCFVSDERVLYAGNAAVIFLAVKFFFPFAYIKRRG